MITYEQLKKDETIRTYIKKADELLSEIGYTEHSFQHVTKVAESAGYILKSLGYSNRDVELVKMAAYLHDIGNIINRADHSQSSALMAFWILNNHGMDSNDIATIISAIGNHDEGTGIPSNHISAALIIADKSDVRRTRVRGNANEYDIHDRVNYSVYNSSILIDESKINITLSLDIDTSYGSIMDYFEIFTERMILCRRAAEQLGLKFRLVINNQQIM